jgi:hypothetical protein
MRSRIMQKPRDGGNRPGPWPTVLESTCLIVDRPGLNRSIDRVPGAFATPAPLGSPTACHVSARGGSRAASLRLRGVRQSRPCGGPIDRVRAAEPESGSKAPIAYRASSGTSAGSGTSRIWEDTPRLISGYALHEAARLTISASTGVGGRRPSGLTTTHTRIRTSWPRLTECASAVIRTGISLSARVVTSGSTLRNDGAESDAWGVA